MKKILPQLRDFVRRADMFLFTVSVICAIYGIIVIASATKSYDNGSAQYVIVQGLALVLGIVLGALFLAFCIAAVVQSGLKGNQLPHGYFSKTKDVSTLNASRRKKAGKAANISSDLPKEN